MPNTGRWIPGAWCCCPQLERVYVACQSSGGAPATVLILEKENGGSGAPSNLAVGVQAWGLAVNADGEIYFSHTQSAGGPQIKRYDADLVLVDSVSPSQNPITGGVAVDASGNVAYCGNNLAFLYDANLDLVWTQDWTAFAAQGPNDVCFGLDGVAYFSGRSGGGTTLVQGTYTVRAWNSSGTNTLNIAKEETNATARVIALDDSGNIFIAVEENDGANSWLRVRKYDSAGSLQWTNTKNGQGLFVLDTIFLALASSGNIYAGGSIFDGTDSVRDGYLRKIDSSGSTVDEISFESSVGSSNVVAICVDLDEHIFLARQNGNSTPNRYAIESYDSSLTFRWGGGNLNLVLDIDCDPGRIPHFQ